MADTSQPSFAIALTAVLAGGAISSWISEAFVGLAPTTSIEVWAILTSVVGAVFVKIVLRSLKYDIPIAFAAGALMAGRLAGLALVQAFPDLQGHAGRATVEGRFRDRGKCLEQRVGFAAGEGAERAEIGVQPGFARGVPRRWSRSAPARRSGRALPGRPGAARTGCPASPLVLPRRCAGSSSQFGEASSPLPAARASGPRAASARPTRRAAPGSASLRSGAPPRRTARVRRSAEQAGAASRSSGGRGRTGGC